MRPKCLQNIRVCRCLKRENGATVDPSSCELGLQPSPPEREGYYLKTRQPEIRLIQCLPKFGKRLNKDFLIMSGEWHDGVPCPIEEGRPGGALEIRVGLVHCLIMICVVWLLTLCFSWFYR